MAGGKGEPFVLRLSADDTEKFAELVEHGALRFILDFPEIDSRAGKAAAERLREMVWAIRTVERGW
jgi:hypothetical protein